MGRDSILLRLMSRRAKTLSDLNKRAGNVLHFEGDGSFVSAGRNEALIAKGGGSASLFAGAGRARLCLQLANQEEAGEVALVVFDAGLENFAGVFQSGVASGNAGSVGKMLGDDVLHAAGRVVERDRFDPGIAAEEVAALVERHRVGERAAQCAELHAGSGNHVVHDAQQEFALDEYVARDQKIGVLGDCAGERILDGDNGGGDRSILQAIENLGGTGAGDDGAARQHALRSFVAEGTEFALDRDLGGGFHHMAR